MKKTTPALVATFLISAVLGGSMFMIGLDATRTTTQTAAVPQGIINIHTSPALAGTITLKTAAPAASNASPVLRTAGS